MSAFVQLSKGRALPEDFERMFQEHHALVYRTAYRVTGNAEDAEDVLQTLFVRLLRRDVVPEFDQNPKAYLYRATMNIALNVIRSRKRIALTNDVEEFEAPRECELGEELRAAMAELSPKAAEILVL